VAVSLERTLQLMQGIALALVTAVGAWLVLRRRLTIGDLTLLTVYVGQLLKPIEKLNDLAETTGRGLAGGDRLLRLLHQSPSVADAPDAVAIPRARGFLQLVGVSFSYPDRDRPVLTGVDLSLSPGALTVLVGKSGAGKSTLLGLLVRLVDPARGEIRLDGIPITRIRLRSLREQFAVLSQDTHLFAGSLRQALAPSGVTEDDALWDALALVSMDSFVRGLPRRLDTPLGEDGVNLSGGQRRRVALARAFLLRRPILLLDEPLANIDAESAAVVLDAIARLRRTCTCFAVTHESALIARADRVVRLVNGRLIEAAGHGVPPVSLARVR
jgi:ATP-binding cassette subfamily B protein